MSLTGGSMPHTAFLQDIQNWVWKRFPTRQLSASDIFYAMQWAETGVPAVFFVDGFEHWLSTHPKEFVTNANLSALRFEADRIVSAYRQLHPVQAPVEFKVDDPFKVILDRLERVGKNTTDDRLRLQLREIYQTMRDGMQKTRSLYPDWKARAEVFYTLKARALILWDESVDHLIQECFSWLSEDEKKQMQTLTPADAMYAMRLGDEALAVYKKTHFQRNVAKFYSMESLLDPV